jgi:hypothetical protein
MAALLVDFEEASRRIRPAVKAGPNDVREIRETSRICSEF